jgi:glycosidase
MNGMNRILAAVIVFFLGLMLTGKAAPKQGKIVLDGQWKFRTDVHNSGMTEGWFQENSDRSSWTAVKVPGYWEEYQACAAYDGVGWFARTFEVKDISEPLTLHFSGIDDDADVWLNGKKIGSHTGYSDPFSLSVDHAVRIGTNEVVVRVVDNGGPGGIYKSITLIRTAELGELLRTKYASMNARKSAEWVKDAVIYEVYLRSFSKEGTFRALEERIPELKKLGVTVVWLMPIHPVGIINRKGTQGSPYSIQDYYGINPEFGTIDDFKSLVNTIHYHGLKVIIDLVANHTAWDNPMIKEHPEWYTHDKNGKIISPNPDWTDVADLNYDQPGLRQYMIQMMKYWVSDVGIDGFRCDVAELVPTDFWESARKELETIKPVMMLSEGSIPEHHVKAFDLTYSWNVYDILESVIKGMTPATTFDSLLKSESYQYPRNSLRMRFNTNHDKNAWDGPAVEKFSPEGAKATAVLMFTYPGVPLIYNGEEVGNNKKLSLFEKVNIDWSKGKDFRELYETLSLLRREHPALREGTYAAVPNSDGAQVYSFLRVRGKDTVVVAINFGSQDVKVKLNLSAISKKHWKDLFTNKNVLMTNGQIDLQLSPLGFAVLIPLSN